MSDPRLPAAENCLGGLPAGHNLLFYLGLMFVGTAVYRYGAGIWADGCW